MGLCLSVAAEGVDNKQAEEHGDYEPTRPQKKKKDIKLPPSEDRNGMCSVPAELHPMSSFAISVSVVYDGLLGFIRFMP